MDIERFRSDTPGCTDRVHLNNAGASLPPEPVIRTVQEHFDLECRIGGYEAFDARSAAVEDAYRAIASLIGAATRNVAFTESATAAYSRALTSIPFERGDVILTTRNDYVSNQLQFLSLESRLGVRVQHAPDAPEGGVDVAAVERGIRRARPRVVCVTHVPTNSGLVQDVAAVGRVCREHDVTYLVDACQSVGQIPVSVDAIGCDFLSATSRKFLRGPRGAGFLYVSDRVLAQDLAPLMIDLHSAEWIDMDRYRLVPDAKRFERFEYAWAMVLGMAEAARYALAQGLNAIEARVGRLADLLRDRLSGLDGVHVLDRGPRLCAIVSVGLARGHPREAMLALRERRINTNAQARPSALIDFDDKGVTGALRLSPHYYNTEAEIDTVVGELREWLENKTGIGPAE